ncbi:MAG: nucleotidyltransferase family protein [Betaproteobacteria bacterium]
MKSAFVQDRFLALLRDPSGTLELDLRFWNDFLVLARRSGLLARFGMQLGDRSLLDRIPGKARDHIRAAFIEVESSQTAVRFECNRVLHALGTRSPPLILLKGAAYLLAGLPLSRGRYIGDLDFMVSREKIDELERTLIEKGWAPTEMDEYDQRYYREWTHEIPPLLHPERETLLDIHHTIAPLTSKVQPDAGALVAAAVPLHDPRLRVLAPADMVLHSAVHLFNDEVGKPLRDLFDLHDLLGHFGARPGFWSELNDRARMHRLGRPFYYALRYTQRLLGTAIPPAVLIDAAVWAPPRLLRPMMDWIFEQRFLPELPEEPRTGAAFARWLYYVRTHWLRMPPQLLARHLTIKAARRVRERFTLKSKDGSA